MAVRRTKDGKALIVDGVSGDGQAMVKILDTNLCELTVLQAPGTFPSAVVLTEEAVDALVAELRGEQKVVPSWKALLVAAGFTLVIVIVASVFGWL